jgi:hypothetical protein
MLAPVSFAPLIDGKIQLNCSPGCKATVAIPPLMRGGALSGGVFVPQPASQQHGYGHTDHKHQNASRKGRASWHAEFVLS